VPHVRADAPRLAHLPTGAAPRDVLRYEVHPRIDAHLPNDDLPIEVHLRVCDRASAVAVVLDEPLLRRFALVRTPRDEALRRQIARRAQADGRQIRAERDRDRFGRRARHHRRAEVRPDVRLRRVIRAVRVTIPALRPIASS